MSDSYDHELERIKMKKIAELNKSEQVTAYNKPVTLTAATFDEFVKEQPMVIIDFWADWCGPCKMVAPVLDQLAKEYSGKVSIGKVNVDEQRQLAMKYGANSIPTFWAFKEGQPVGRFAGAQPRPVFENLIQQMIELDMEEVMKEQNKN